MQTLHGDLPLLKLQSTSDRSKVSGTENTHVKGYRPEIAGLRAIAVLAVVIYHAGVQQLAGGFAGVDVFFVISGFLITSIIVRDLELGRFSFAEFYSRRAKRLFPAAMATVFVTVAFGWVMLGPGQYIKLAESSIAALFFVSNFYFMLNTGYFDQSAEVLPLLHMWSLGVEEQFYIVVPIVLFFAFRRFGRLGIISAVAATTLATFLLSASISATYAKFAFFMLATRAWELGMGGLIALAPRLGTHRSAIGNMLSISGLTLVVLGIFTITTDVPYPGVWAVLPTLGTALVIYGTTTKRNFVASVLSAKPLEWVGKISYSCYLWHWPLIVYYRIYISERPFEPLEVASLVAGSLALGWMSWRFIEETFRHSTAQPWSAIGRSVTAMTVVAAICLVIVWKGGFSMRENPEAADLTDLDTMWEFDCVDTIAMPGAGDSCVVGVKWDQAARKGVLWGDSHADHFAPIVDRWAREMNIAIVVGPRSCPAFLNGTTSYVHRADRPNYSEICGNKQRLTVEWLSDHPEVNLIIMAAAWSGYIDTLSPSSSIPPLARADAGSVMKSSLIELLGKIDTPSRDVLLIGDVPRPRVNLNACAALEASSLWRYGCAVDHQSLEANATREFQRVTNEALVDSASDDRKVDVLIPTDSMCGNASCSTVWNGEFIYRDNNHIRRNLKPSTIELIGRTIGIEEYFQRLSP